MPSITRALSRLFPISSTISTAATMAPKIDAASVQGYIASVPFNSGTGRENPIRMADSRLAAIFTSVRNTIGASISMAGHGGNTFGYAGSILPVSHIPPCACRPDREKSAVGLTLRMEAITMPSITLRAIRAFFPAFTRRAALRAYLRGNLSAVALVRLIGEVR